MSKLNDIIEEFQWADNDMRLEMLLDWSRKLPPLPEQYREEVRAGIGRVPECMTPVFMFPQTDDEGRLHLNVEVADEAPTVKGIVSILVNGFDGATPAEVAQAPTDLLHQLGLNDQIRMTRAIGVAGIIGRIKRAAAELSGA